MSRYALNIPRFLFGTDEILIRIFLFVTWNPYQKRLVVKTVRIQIYVLYVFIGNIAVRWLFICNYWWIRFAKAGVEEKVYIYNMYLSIIKLIVLKLYGWYQLILQRFHFSLLRCIYTHHLIVLLSSRTLIIVT